MMTKNHFHKFNLQLIEKYDSIECAEACARYDDAWNRVKASHCMRATHANNRKHMLWASRDFANSF